MDLFSYFSKLKPSSVAKGVGIFVLGLAALTIIISLSHNSTVPLPLFQKGGSAMNSIGMGESAMMYPGAAGSVGMPTLSARNIVAPSMPPIPGDPSSPIGDTAENFEVTDYNGTIETHNLNQTCAVFTDLKPKNYVIFENANRYDSGCNYTFKVEHDHVDEILAIVKGLNPKELAQNTQTIKRQIDDFTSEMDILQKKKASIDDTLQQATQAYDEITAIATKSQDASSLAKVIDSKLEILERLTQARLDINAQLDQLSRSKADQLDRMQYTYFQINVQEIKFIDVKSLKDSWRVAVQDFVQTLNGIVQGLTITMVALLFLALQYVVYLLILLVLAKYGWKLAKRIWKM